MINKEVLTKLKDSIKLNVYEVKIWTSLLARGISSAGELADISGVPRSRCYDVLESLEKKGFVFMKIGKPIKYIAVAPEEVLETIKKETRIEENRLLALMDSIKETDAFGELQKLYTNGINYVNSDEISTSIKGRNNINVFLKEIFGKATKNITIHTTEKGLKRKMKVLKKAYSKKVNVSVHAPVDKLDAMDENIVFNKSDKGLRLVNVDDELLLFTSHEEVDPEHELAIWIKSKFVIDAINGFIE
ncbi:MAG: TrmB family transcriptional regulator [Nanoarchaeota archaeon]|nr:TrmB family transcriptional regulator [Nanoarchaeota archaeon]